MKFTRFRVNSKENKILRRKLIRIINQKDVFNPKEINIPDHIKIRTIEVLTKRKYLKACQDGEYLRIKVIPYTTRPRVKSSSYKLVGNSNTNLNSHESIRSKKTHRSTTIL